MQTITNPIGQDDDVEQNNMQLAETPPMSRSARRAELEAALRGLKEGSVSEQEAAGVIERMVDDLRDELSSPAKPSVLGPVIQSVVARMTEAPT